MITANIQELISGKGFIMVNKGLAKTVGLVASTIYGELVSTFLYWKDREQLTEHEGKEWFFCTIEDLEDKTTIKKDAQNKAIKALEKEGLIITARFGLPAKRYFHITDKYIQILLDNYFSEKPKTDNDGLFTEESNNKSLDNQISEKPKTGFLENRKLDFGKTDTNKKEFNKKNSNKDLLTIVNLQENEIITDESEFKKTFTDICNSFYTVFAINRWSKKQWNTLIEKFVTETIEDGRHKNIPVEKMKGYAFKSIELMAKRNNSKNGLYNPLENHSGDVPFYDWLNS